MSLTILRSQGVYESERPPFEYPNAYFDGFQNCEFMSGSVATPRLPIELPLASGAMESVVTPVLTGLNSLSFMSFCAEAAAEASSMHVMAVNILYFILFLKLIFNSFIARQRSSAILNIAKEMTSLFHVLSHDTIPVRLFCLECRGNPRIWIRCFPCFSISVCLRNL